MDMWQEEKRMKHESVNSSTGGGLEFRWDSETHWRFVHVTVKLISGKTQRCVMESWITSFLLHTRNSSTCEPSPCDMEVVKEEMRRVSRALSASSFLSLTGA